MEGNEIETGGESSAVSDVTPDLEASITAAFRGAADVEAGDEGGDEAPPHDWSRTSQQLQRQARSQKDQTDSLEQEGLENPDKTGEQTETPVSSDDAGEVEEAPAEEKPVEKVEAPKVDPTLRFAAQEMGLTDDEINGLMTANPAAGLKTLTALADAHANLSRQMAFGGSPVAPGTQPNAQQLAQSEASPTPRLDKFMSELAAFSEANGEEMAGFAKIVNEELAAPLRAMIAENRVQAQRLQAQEAQTTFGSIRKDFEPFYGPEAGNLSPAQQKARNDLASIADQIRAGAKLQGKDVSIADAIKRAHGVVAAEYRSAEARKSVASQVQKRAMSITAKPTQRRSSLTVGAQSDQAAIAAYSKRAAQHGLEVDDI